jgi:hypothetical protein
VFLLGYGIYLGINSIKVRLNYSTLENEAERLFAPVSQCPPADVPRRLLKKADEQNIPLKEKDVKLYDDDWNGFRVLSFNYVDSVKIFGSKFLYFDFSFVDTVFYNSQ